VTASSSNSFTGMPPPHAGNTANTGMPAGPGGRPATPDRAPAAPAGDTRPTVTVAEFEDYISAQRAVDFLSDNQFPVDRVEIVGTNLRLVERVLGRLTVGRAALAGAGTGAWFGLLIGILIGVFSPSLWWLVILVALIAGTVWGAVFGAIAHALTGGRRDFTSQSMLQAERYALVIDAEYADRVRELLRRPRQ
jgi:hypothetical protein